MQRFRGLEKKLASRRLELPVCRLLGRRTDKAADDAVAAMQRAAQARDKGWHAGAGRADRAEARDTSARNAAFFWFELPVTAFGNCAALTRRTRKATVVAQATVSPRRRRSAAAAAARR